MCFIEKETCHFILKFREIFLLRETLLRAHKMKSDEKPFFCQIYLTFQEKMVHVVLDRYCSLFLKGLKIFPNLMLSLIVLLTPCLTSVTWSWVGSIYDMGPLSKFIAAHPYQNQT